MSDENKKVNENDPKAKMLAALAKNIKVAIVAKPVGQVLVLKSVLVKQVGLPQRCIEEKLDLLNHFCI
jgi:hypothetical protein